MKLSEVDRRQPENISDWPKFLSRLDNEPNALEPPALPRLAVVIDTRNVMTVGTTAAAAAVFVMASATVIGGASQTNPEQHGIENAKHDQAHPSLQVADPAFARLGYADNLVNFLEVTAFPQIETDKSDEPVLALPSDATFDEQHNSIGPFILANSPEGIATSPLGEQTAWSLAAKNPEQIVLTPENIFEHPISSNMELFSVAVASTSENNDAVRAESKSPPAYTERGHVEKQDKKSKPALRQKMTRKSLIETREIKQRRNRKVPHSTKIPSPDKLKVEKSGELAQNSDSSSDEKSGLFTKFFAWLKSKQPPSTSNNSETSIGMFPQQ